MTAVADASTRIRGLADGLLSAECLPCRVHFEQLPRAETRAALAAFDAHHPGAAGAVHASRTPPGWRRAAGGR